MLSRCGALSAGNLTQIVRDDLDYDFSTFECMNKSMGVGTIYNPNSDAITSHPYVKRFIQEIQERSLKKKLSWSISSKGILSIYHVCEYTQYRTFYAAINTSTFDIYTSHGKTPKGNLKDEPWHGLDLLESYGTIARSFKDTDRETRIRRLVKKYGTYKV
jgi:hypothetical protein